MISINNLQKKFGEKLAVNIDHYEINQGDMLGLVGNNGAGKTTLFRLMLDLLKADNGLRTGIEEVERFVEYQQLRIMKHGGDDADFLFITG